MLMLELGAWNSCITVIFPWRCWPCLHNEGQIQRWGLGKCLRDKLGITPRAILEPLQGLPCLPVGSTQCLAWCLHLPLLASLHVMAHEQTQQWPLPRRESPDTACCQGKWDLRQPEISLECSLSSAGSENALSFGSPWEQPASGPAGPS